MSKILLIEEYPPSRDFLAQLLRYGGHDVVEAEDGGIGVDLAEADPPDLVITDLLMPTTDGFEVARRIRSSSRIAATPIIFYTASHQGREAQRLADACGVAAFVSKGSEPKAIVA